MRYAPGIYRRASQDFTNRMAMNAAGRYSLVVPSNVYQIRFKIWGAGGGGGGASKDYPGGKGTNGDFRFGEINVEPGTTLYFWVGNGGYGGGNSALGNNGGGGGGGGGFTGITTSLDLSSRIIAVGSGGGGGGAGTAYQGGTDGTTTERNGGPNITGFPTDRAGSNATTSAAGAGGNNGQQWGGSNGSVTGGGGGGTAGGIGNHGWGGLYGLGGESIEGTTGFGGAGGQGVTHSNPGRGGGGGGGGGAGWFGGGGGAGALLQSAAYGGALPGHGGGVGGNGSTHAIHNGTFETSSTSWALDSDWQTPRGIGGAGATAGSSVRGINGGSGLIVIYY